MRLKLKPRAAFLHRGVNIPGSVWAEPHMNFQPMDFGIGDERLKEKVFPGALQSQSLERWQKDPTRSITYGVASAPSDSKAKMFAAYLVQTYLEVTPPNCSVLWETLTGGFENRAMGHEPSLLVLSGLTPNSTAVKLEKARDLLEKNSHIPRIVVVAGEDPVTFFSTKLYYNLNEMFFHSSTIMKRKVEVV